VDANQGRAAKGQPFQSGKQTLVNKKTTKKTVPHFASVEPAPLIPKPAPTGKIGAVKPEFNENDFERF
jgi:hypothetical protein